MRTSFLFAALAATLLTPSLAGAKPRLRLDPALPAASCAGFGKHVTTDVPSRPFRREGNVVLRTLSWGCGCPRGSVFTLAYEPKTRPLRVRLCEDQSKDACEMACQRDWRWDLTQALTDAGTKDIQFVNP